MEPFDEAPENEAMIHTESAIPLGFQFSVCSSLKHCKEIKAVPVLAGKMMAMPFSEKQGLLSSRIFPVVYIHTN